MPSTTEGRLLLALQDYHRSTFPSIRAAAAAYDVPESTLRRRAKGILSRAETRSKSCKLTTTEEELLLNRVLQQATEGQSLQQAHVRETANIILKSRQLESPQEVGQKWNRNFVNRHPQLKTVYNRKYDYQRAECEDADLIRAWFQLVHDTIEKYGVPEEDIYNFDETGFQMGVISTSKVVTSSETRGRARTTQPGNREWVTAICAISATGQTIPPFIIFKAKLHQKVWYQTGIPTTWKLAVSENGWTTDELSLQWIQHFDQHTAHVSLGTWRLLIFDGHGSHMTTRFREFCLQNHILTLCMPAHSSHILQPLDVSCFGPLKRSYGQKIEGKMRLGHNHITKVEFLPAFQAAYNQVMTISTITAGFRATGLVPFNPERVLSTLTPILGTPSPRSSQSSVWESKTPKTLQEIRKQATLVHKRMRSASPSEMPFAKLLKGFEMAVYDRAILIAENAALRAENQYQKQKRAQPKGVLQKGGSLSIEQGLEMIGTRILAEQPVIEAENSQAENLSAQSEPAVARASRKCSKCHLVGHNVRSCRL
jgi:hypothetical protein